MNRKNAFTCFTLIHNDVDLETIWVPWIILVLSSRQRQIFHSSMHWYYGVFQVWCIHNYSELGMFDNNMFIFKEYPTGRRLDYNYRHSISQGLCNNALDPISIELFQPLARKASARKARRSWTNTLASSCFRSFSYTCTLEWAFLKTSFTIETFVDFEIIEEKKKDELVFSHQMLIPYQSTLDLNWKLHFNTQFFKVINFLWLDYCIILV
jgi:hypothetical protein